MRIFYKLIAGFIFVTLLTSAVVYIGMTATGNVSQTYKNIVEETIPVIESLEKLRYLGINIHLYTHEFIFKIESKEGTEGPEDILGKLKETFEQYNNTIKKLDVLVEKYFPDKKERNDDIKRIGEKYIGLSNEVIELKKSGASAENYNETYQEFETVEKEFLAAVDNAIENEHEEFQERTNNLESTIALSRDLVLIASLLTFILSIVIGTAISISISGPITILKNAADDIRKGKLDTAVEIRSNDETGILADAFNKMVSDLAHEIEEHKQTAISLAEKNEFVKTVLESLPHPFYVIDAKDYTIKLANSAASVKGSATGTTCYALTHKADKPCGTEGHLCPLEEVKRTGKPAVAEHLHYDKDGNARDVEVHCYPIFDEKGNLVQVIEYSLDITERKRSEEALHESEERFRSVSQSASDAIITSDSDGNIVFWNNGAQKTFGYQSFEVIGKPLTLLIPQRYRDAYIKGLERLHITGKSPLIGKTVEMEALKKDGTEFQTELSLSTWKSGEKIFYSGILRDITERRRNEDIRRENERLSLANRAKSEFLTVMSHELRTPLNSIIGFSELLNNKDAGELNEKQKRYVENVHSSGKHLLSIIDDILDLTRVESGKMELNIEKMSVPKVIRKSADIIKEQAAKQNIRIITQVSPDIEFIETDANRFRQVLNNLLDNAVKFSKAGGGTVTITAVKEADMAKFSVSDTGIGIKEEDMCRLFQSFEQLDAGIARKYGGTGLGLAVSKKLVELMGGRITVESRYGEGSTFTFYLPVSAKKEGGMI